MRQEAVALTYLEWVRLIGTGAIRLDETRIVRWRSDRADPAEVVCDLMRSAPDLGTSATSFVLAVLEPEVLDRVREGGLDLGRRLDLAAVRSFHSFGETALAVHRHDAEAAGVSIDLTPLAAGWTTWTTAVEAADRRARGEALLALLSVSPCDRIGEAAARLADRERRIVPEDFIRARDTLFFGWACVLNAQKVSTGVAPDLPGDVMDEVNALRRDYDVERPFLARAPRLCAFVGSLAAEGEPPADLLAMASLKQHERYVIKREGAALDLPSLFDDIHILEGLDAGAAGLLVQALGERMPAELIRALKVRGVTRIVAPAGAPTPVGEDALGAPDSLDGVEVGEAPGPSPSQPSQDALASPDSPSVPDRSGEAPAEGAVETPDVVAAEDPAPVPDEAVSEPSQEADTPSDPTDSTQRSSDPDQPGLDLEPNQTKVAEAGSPGSVAPRSSKDGQQPDVPPGRKPRARSSAPGTKSPRKRANQPINEVDQH